MDPTFGWPRLIGVDPRIFVLELRRAAMVEQQALETTEELLGRAVGDIAGSITTMFFALGDELGLFKALADSPATGAELARALGLHERYVREWGDGLVAAGYLSRDRDARYTMPAALAPIVAEEGGPAFMGGAYQMIREMVGTLDAIGESFRSGGGVPLEAYRDGFWSGLERLTGPSFAHQLVQEWIPAVPGLSARLEAGARIADVGTGTGVAPIKLAQSFPATVVTGFDIQGPNVERASRAAREAGIADRVLFEQADGVNEISGRYDLITMFAVVHDTRDPLALLRNARAALADDGVLLIDELNCHGSPEEDQGPLGTLIYGFSLLHCTPQSLAEGGAALGAAGLPEARLRELCLAAGFGTLEKVWEGGLDAVYAARP